MISKQKSEKWRDTLLGLSPWILAAACTLLLLLLTLFSLANYKREKELIIEALIQKGLTLMRFINSSARESVRANLRSSSEWLSWETHVQTAIEQAVEQPGVEFILIVDASGKVIASGGQQQPNGRIDAATQLFAAQLETEPFDHFVSRVIETPDRKKTFQIAARYLPPNGPGMMPHPDDDRGTHRRQGMMQGMMQRFSGHPNIATIVSEMRNLIALKPVYVVQLDMQQFNMPLKRQLLQVVILLVVIVLVGAGGTLSFLTLKGLRGSQRRLGSIQAYTGNLIASLPIGIVATDSTVRLQICNAAACEILEMKGQGQVISQLPTRVLPPILAAQFSEERDDIANMELSQHEIVVALAKGERTLQVGSLPVYNVDGSFAGETLLIRDLTEIRQLEKDLQRSERLAALGKMAAGVAHELRNPLSSIKGLAVLLKKSISPEAENTDTADILVREVDRLNRSIGELLDYAKPGQLTKEPLDLAEFVSKTVSLISMDAKAYNIDIEIMMEDNLPKVSADRDKLNQVLLNLLLNSIQAMPDGGVLIVAAQTYGEGKVVLRVRDTGQGISPENLPKVFDPYFTTKNDGTGLGLAMSAKIVGEHDGEIKIDSTPGESTVVEVILPIMPRT